MTSEVQKKHHIRADLCTTRPTYRDGRKLKAVKVYTVSQESKYLLVQGVPAINVQKELLALFSSFGEVKEHRHIEEYPAEQFTEVVLIKFARIQSARIAKKSLDDHNFYGGVLHVCYAPEFETVEETSQKLQDRRKSVIRRIRQLDKEVEELQNNETGGEDSEHAVAVKKVRIEAGQTTVGATPSTSLHKTDVASAGLPELYSASNEQQPVTNSYPPLPPPPSTNPGYMWQNLCPPQLSGPTATLQNPSFGCNFPPTFLSEHQ